MLGVRLRLVGRGVDVISHVEGIKSNDVRMNNGKEEGEERRYVGESLAERMRGGPESDADKQSISGSIWSTKS
jgi:hypothetical protein